MVVLGGGEVLMNEVPLYMHVTDVVLSVTKSGPLMLGRCWRDKWTVLSELLAYRGTSLIRNRSPS